MNRQPDPAASLDAIAANYSELDFDRQVVRRAARLLAERVRGRRVLEMGCSLLDLSRALCAAAREFEIVEGAQRFVRLAKSELGDRAKVHHALFEEFKPTARYEVIVFANTIHHIADAGALLARIRGWLTLGGFLILTAPNVLSLHRRVGVKMGLLPEPAAASQRNVNFAQPGRYTMPELVKLVEVSGYRILATSTYFLKPLDNAQMERLKPTDSLLDALFDLGREFPEMASTLYVEASPQ